MLSILFALALAIGQLAPGFTLVNQDKQPVSLASSRGHKTVLVFYRGYW